MSQQRQAHLSPLQTVKCSCLICEQEASYSKVRTTLYAEKKRDIDLRPIQIQWSNKVSPKVDPKLFYFWQCPFCGFTADHQFFLTPFKDGGMSPGRFRKLFIKARDQNAQAATMLGLLQINPDADKSVIIATMKQNLLAIYLWEMLDEMVQNDSLALGAYYLRLAWLKHDLKRIKLKNPSLFRDVQMLLTKLRKLWPNMVHDEREALEFSVRYYQQALSKSSVINTVLQEVQIRLILVRLRIKLGQLRSAKASLLEAKSRVTSFAQIVRRKLNESSHAVDDMPREMECSLAKMQSMVREVELILEDVEAKVLARKLKEAQTLLIGHDEKSYEERLALLREAKVNETIVNLVLPVQKKKRFFAWRKSG